MSSSSGPGRTLALVVGLGLAGAAAIVAATGGEPVLVTILAVIGAAALSGWARARPRPPGKTP